MARFCTSCGSPLDDGAVFCGKCGKSMAGAAAGGGAASTAIAPVEAGLNQNMAGALAYVTIIPAIVFLVVAPYNTNRFIRFHAFQSLFIGITWLVIDAVLGFTVFLWMLIHLVNLLLFVVAVIAAVKAYGGQQWKVPIIGDIAEKQANS
ncbi:MAG TPA: zinc-ribbon domain-containing protein [Terriglobales bacterium]|nr:zinc-ribbon domain-containing protein [Terriglobales bacterium]